MAPLASLAAGLGLSGCGGGGDAGASASSSSTDSTNGSSSTGKAKSTSPSRTWKMGFTGTAPRPDVASVIANIDQWSQRAEFVVIHEELPWTKLLSGTSPDAIIDSDKMPLVNYYRGKGLQILFMADLNDGLARDKEAPQLRALGRSITEPAVQAAYRSYMLAVARKIQPDQIGLAAETNLVRVAAPALYAAIKQAANAAASDLRGAGVAVPLLVSVQVETAWGLLGTSGGVFSGIETDLADFPFMQMLGLSSYPYMAFSQPESIPDDYYSRLLGGRSDLPVIVTEGGWTSASVGSVASSPDKQARYVTRHAKLLDGIQAQGVTQLLYADLDLSSYPQPWPATLPLFAALGLTDTAFNAKPALAVWDGLHARAMVG